MPRPKRKIYYKLKVDGYWWSHKHNKWCHEDCIQPGIVYWPSKFLFTMRAAWRAFLNAPEPIDGEIILSRIYHYKGYQRIKEWVLFNKE